MEALLDPPALIDQPGFDARIRRREPTAICAVVDAYLKQILRASRSAGLDAATAEDVTQMTFVTFIEGAPRFEGRSRVRTWLFGILYRKISETRRATRRSVQVDDIDRVMDERFLPNGSWRNPPGAPDRKLRDQEIRRMFQDCLQGVPDRQRAAFTLQEVEGLSKAEICEILEVKPTNLGVMLYRARNRLRECLEAGGIGV